ncbi:hypothetical protein [Paraburkholderia ginsengiterrae]|nr:hypothetical protein [Paraburkholderia ginsengiterrae]
MKRLLAILVFVTGGFAAELAHPVHCSLISSSRAELKRRKR